MASVGATRSENTPNENESERVAGEFFWSFAEKHEIPQKYQADLLGIRYNRERLKSLKVSKAVPNQNDTLLRVSHLMAIHRSLRILFSDPSNRDVVYNWLKVDREIFGGKSALEYIRSGSHPFYQLQRLESVRNFLDAQRVS